jgi:dihydroorotase
MRVLTLQTPDDWHLHLRDEAMLSETVPATARSFRRAIVMPNLKPPVRNAADAVAYRERILAARPTGSHFEPLMTLYLTDATTVADIHAAKAAGVTAVKLYPAGATTNADSGVTDLVGRYPIFEAMAEVDMPLLIHGEVTDSHIDIFDREKVFIDNKLAPLVASLPQLKVVFEHITTQDAVQFVLSTSSHVAATITPQHLMLSRNDMLVGGIRPHLYCLPILKRNTHQHALRQAAVSGSPKFFLGTDSAPHTQPDKETACGCAGCYSARSAIEFYATVFEEMDALDRLEAFASHFGPDFYGLPRNGGTITLRQEAWQIPAQIQVKGIPDPIIPLMAGVTLNWRLAASI